MVFGESPAGRASRDPRAMGAGHLGRELTTLRIPYSTTPGFAWPRTRSLELLFPDGGHSKVANSSHGQSGQSAPLHLPKDCIGQGVAFIRPHSWPWQAGRVG